MSSTQQSPAPPAEQSERLTLRTYRECAEIMKVHWTRAQQLERAALAKLAAHPTMRRLFEELE